MVVTTRSQKNSSKSLIILNVDKKKKGLAPSRKAVKKTKRDDDDEENESLPCENKTRDEEDSEDHSEDESSDDESEDEKEFYLPSGLDEVCSAKAKETMEYITQKNTVSLEQILQAPLRKKHRAHLFELYFVFDESLPMSEERMGLRKLLKVLFEQYSAEYKKFKKSKKEILLLEKECKKDRFTDSQQYAIVQLETSIKNKKVIYRKWLELEEMEQQDDEYFKLRNWIEWSLKVPHDRVKVYSMVNEPLNTFLKSIQQRLDAKLYGMKSVKEEILLFLHQKLSTPSMKGCCLGLVGDSGVGKTTIARTLGEVMDFPFEQISLGGATNPEFLKGFDFTYVGSQPGEITRCLARLGYKNGILFFDEFEKVSQREDILSFLLHITDFSQNHDFRDNYLSDISVDLSCLWMIYSMNELPQEKALTDRIYTIHVPGYSVKEKSHIVQDYLLPKLVDAVFKKDDPPEFLFPESEVMFFIEKIHASHHSSAGACGGGGIRKIQFALQHMLHKLNFWLCHGTEIPTSFGEGVAKLVTDKSRIVFSNEMITLLLKDYDKKTGQKSDFLSLYV